MEKPCMVFLYNDFAIYLEWMVRYIQICICTLNEAHKDVLREDYYQHTLRMIYASHFFIGSWEHKNDKNHLVDMRDLKGRWWIGNESGKNISRRGKQWKGLYHVSCLMSWYYDVRCMYFCDRIHYLFIAKCHQSLQAWNILLCS